MQTRGIVKTSGFIRGICKNRFCFSKFKGFCAGIPREESESVKCHFSKCRFGAESEKSGTCSTRGAASKNKPKKPLDCIFSQWPCRNRCRFREVQIIMRRIRNNTVKPSLARWPLTMSEIGALENASKPPGKSPERWTFLSLAFYNVCSLPTVKIKQCK